MEQILGKWSHWTLSDKGHHVKFFTHKGRAFPFKLEKHNFNGLIIYTFWRVALFLDYRGAD